MAIGELTRPYPVLAAGAVAENLSDRRWSVSVSGWRRVLPDLPDEVIALLAAPVVVRAHRAEPEDEERYPAPTEPCAQHAPAGERTVQFLAPALLAPTPARARRTRRP